MVCHDEFVGCQKKLWTGANKIREVLFVCRFLRVGVVYEFL